MNLSELWAQIEEEYKWRMDEIRFFSNQLIHLKTDEEKNQFRRGIILLLYAHFEGFCKFSFLLYTGTINKENLICNDVNYSIAASGLADLFNELRNPNKKSTVFKNVLPEDAKLHRFARDKEFLEAMSSFSNRPLVIPDKIVDTESNLKPIVLSKILFVLGFDHTAFKAIDADIHLLLNYRNSIAHGQNRDGITEGTYEKIRASTIKIVDEIKALIMQSLTERNFLK